MSDYLSITTIPSHTTARAADVNSRFQQVESAFDMLPAPDVLELAVKPTVLAGGTLNALTVTNAQPVGAYALGQEINFKAAFTNGAAATVNVDGLGNKEIRRADGTALLAGDIVAGRIYELKYDGSFFQMMRVTAVETLSYQIAAAASAAAAFISAGDAADEATAAAASAAAAAASAASIDVSNIVHRSGVESIAGTKTFSSAIVASAGVTINGQTLDILSANGCSLIEAANYAAMRTLLSLTPGTDVQAQSANLSTLAGLASITNLSAIAGLTSAADKLAYFTGAGTAALTDLSSVARTLLGQTSQANMRTTGLGLAAVANTASAADLTTGNLAVARLNGGTSASSATFWRGDGTWAGAGRALFASLAADDTATAGSNTVNTAIGNTISLTTGKYILEFSGEYTGLATCKMGLAVTLASLVGAVNYGVDTEIFYDAAASTKYSTGGTTAGTISTPTGTAVVGAATSYRFRMILRIEVGTSIDVGFRTSPTVANATIKKGAVVVKETLA